MDSNMDFLPSNWSPNDEVLHENFENVKQLLEQILSEVPETRFNNHPLVKKYFNYWKEYTMNRKEIQQTEEQNISQKRKLKNFLKKVKNMKNNTSVTNEASNDLAIKENVNNQDPKSKNKVNRNNLGSVYKKRFEAQQDIIIMQKIKLEQQQKLIEDLKLGRITEEIKNSLETSKFEIREIFSKSSTRTKCTVVPLLEDTSNIKNFQLTSEKAPRIVQEMERRAEERALRRQIILERKRIIEEEKKRAAELLLEQKRVQDEEERRKSLEEMKEKRRKEMEQQKIRQRNKEIYLNHLNIAMFHHNRKLKRFGFEAFRKLKDIKHKNRALSIKFYATSLTKKCFNSWLQFHLEIEKKAQEKADSHYKIKAFNKYMNLFKAIIKSKRQSVQVASDIYDLKLQIKYFSKWHIYACKRYVINERNTELANKHYNNRLQWQYFYQWRKLPAVIQLEKAKQQKLRKWREKVWEIIPDFRPDALD